MSPLIWGFWRRTLLQDWSPMSDAPAENDLVWTEACLREEALRGLHRRYLGRMTKTAVEDVAWELGLSRTTLDLLIGRSAPSLMLAIGKGTVP
jgi:hypothetical protein